jgi:hypothetical protein
MNINITKVSNGWVATNYNYDQTGTPYPMAYPTKSGHVQEQFVFLTLEELINWIKTTAVMNQLTK